MGLGIQRALKIAIVGGMKFEVLKFDHKSVSASREPSLAHSPMPIYVAGGFALRSVAFTGISEYKSVVSKT